MDTKFFNSNGDPIVQLFLPSTILLANIDYSGLLDYTLKAVLGGLIWIAFKYASDYMDKKKIRKIKNDISKQNND